MHVEGYNLFISLKNLSCPIALVDIQINDQKACHTIFSLGSPDSYGNVIEGTETLATAGKSVMSASCFAAKQLALVSNGLPDYHSSSSVSSFDATLTCFRPAMLAASGRFHSRTPRVAARVPPALARAL